MSLLRAMLAHTQFAFVFIQLSLMQFRERSIRALAAFAIGFLPGIASADEDLADMFSSVATGAKSAQTSGLVIAQAIGVFIFIGSVLAFKKVNKDPHVTPLRCAVGLVIGALLVIIPQIISRTQRQMGTSSTTIS